MNQKTTKYLIPSLLVIFLALSVFLYIKNLQLKKFNTELQETVAKTESREKAIKKKYSEEKAKATALQRAKLASDSQMRALEAEVETLQAEMDRTSGDKDMIIKEMEGKLEKVKSALSEMSKQYDTLSARFTESVEKLGKANNEIQNLETEVAEHREEIRVLQSDLKTANRKLDRAVGHNAELAEIGEELLAEFDNQNVFDSLLEKEPFTQAKRVSMETMIQEYLNRIDNEIITGTDDL